MFLASFLIGLREGLEAALVIGILVAFVKKQARADLVVRIAAGATCAIVLTVALGALFTFGRYSLTFQAQEIIGGTMSLIAVAMVTSMIFWMMKVGSKIKGELESQAGHALALGTGWGMFLLSFVTVGREGLETTLMLWGWALQPNALLGALTGILTAAGIGWLMEKGMVRFNFTTFFNWTGIFLIVVAAGILAYAIHDLQEATVLPGPFSGAPITPTDFRTGEVLVGFFTELPYWAAPFPFGWAFDLTDVMDPSGAVAAFLKGTVGFTPLMSWLEVIAWALYLAIVLPMFVRRMRKPRASKVPASRNSPEAERTPTLTTETNSTPISVPN